jgi:RNA polymerase sigma-70 factor (ECF subfamily)
MAAMHASTLQSLPAPNLCRWRHLTTRPWCGARRQATWMRSTSSSCGTSARSLTLRLLRDVGLAEDATQDAFIRAWQNIGSFQTGSVRSWLYKIATNRAYDMLRASARRPAGSLEAEMVEIEPIWSAGGAGEESPDAHALRRELSIYLERALISLPDDQRMVVMLVDVQGLDYHEVAETMGIALGTVKSRLSRARAKVRQALADDTDARELFERYLRLQADTDRHEAPPATPTTETRDA